MKKGTKFKYLGLLLMVTMLSTVFAFPCFAKTTTRSGCFLGGACLEATMTYNVSSSGIVSNGRVDKVVKMKQSWASTYSNGSKAAVRYDNNKFYLARTTGTWMDIGDTKVRMIKADIKGFGK